jgi:hypothetical protein
MPPPEIFLELDRAVELGFIARLLRANGSVIDVVLFSGRADEELSLALLLLDEPRGRFEKILLGSYQAGRIRGVASNPLIVSLGSVLGTVEESCV